MRGNMEKVRSNAAKKHLEADGFVELPQRENTPFSRADVPTDNSFPVLDLPRNISDIDLFFKLFPKSLVRIIALRSMGLGPNAKPSHSAVQGILVQIAVNLSIRLEGRVSPSAAKVYVHETKILRPSIEKALNSLHKPDMPAKIGLNRIEKAISHFWFGDPEIEILNKAFLSCIAVRFYSLIYETLLYLFYYSGIWGLRERRREALLLLWYDGVGPQSRLEARFCRELELHRLRIGPFSPSFCQY